MANLRFLSSMMMQVGVESDLIDKLVLLSLMMPVGIEPDVVKLSF
jgi:hypothetical protein